MQHDPHADNFDPQTVSPERVCKPSMLQAPLKIVLELIEADSLITAFP
jgi:hypothetical protein